MKQEAEKNYDTLFKTKLITDDSNYEKTKNIDFNLKIWFNKDLEETLFSFQYNSDRKELKLISSDVDFMDNNLFQLFSSTRNEIKKRIGETSDRSLKEFFKREAKQETKLEEETQEKKTKKMEKIKKKKIEELEMSNANNLVLEGANPEKEEKNKLIW